MRAYSVLSFLEAWLRDRLPLLRNLTSAETWHCSPLFLFPSPGLTQKTPHEQKPKVQSNQRASVPKPVIHGRFERLISDLQHFSCRCGNQPTNLQSHAVGYTENEASKFLRRGAI